MAERFMLTRGQIIGISALVAVLAALLQAWVLYSWLGFGFWFLALVVPLCLVAMQAVGGTLAVALHKQYGDPNTPLLPRA